MANIIFEEGEKNGTWIWHYGQVEDENKEFPFTVLEMQCNLTGLSSFELTWCDDEPEDSEKMEKEILSRF